MASRWKRSSRSWLSASSGGRILSATCRLEILEGGEVVEAALRKVEGENVTRDELRESLLRQAGALKDGGILFHSFWQGEGEDEIYGMLTTYYTEETLAELVGDEFEIVEIAPYAEMDDDDSLYLILKKV